MTSASSSSSPELAPPNTSHFHHPPDPKYSSLSQVVDDLSSRFILNLPDDELNSLERICFQVEQAHWFYEDFIREANPTLPSFPLKKFSELLFTSIPVLHRWSGDHEGAFNHFMQYKTRVPVCGAIMLNDTWDKVVLVKGWKASAGWGFPKGKINESEERHACAVREVLEETGYNLAGMIEPDDVIEVSIREQQVSLFIVTGVPEDYPFETKTRKEISKIDWFRLNDLPTWRRNKPVPGKFYLISPFIGPLKAFISKRKPRHLQVRQKGKQQSYRSNLDFQEESDWSAADFNHSSGQENGSQTSSGDATDPQTPSPQYSEPVVHTANEIASDAIALEGIMDPQLARLLSGLSLSAAAAPSGVSASEPLASSLGAKPPIQVSTPVPPSPADPIDSPDWSMRQPQKPRDHPYQKSAPVGLSNVETSISTSTDTIRALSSSSPKSPPPSATLSTTSSISGANFTAPKRTGTADLSPYMSRPGEQTVNGKRLRQLALLESVVDESARMTPAPGQRTVQPTSPVAPIAAPAHISAFPPTSALPAPPYPPSTSVPPTNFMQHPNLSHMYQHTPSRDARPPQTIYQTLPSNPVAGIALQDEAFVVRPRTSNNFRPIPAPSSRHHPFGARASMSQAQLLGILSNAHPPPVRPLPGQPPMMYAPRSEVPATGPPPMYNPSFVGPAAGIRSLPGRATPAASAHLLNILNTRGPSVAPPPHSHYPQYAGLGPQ